MTAALRRRHRVVAVVFLTLLAVEVIWGPGGCDGCAAQVVRSR